MCPLPAQAVGTVKGDNDVYSYVIEFNLAQRGSEAEDYLCDAARLWPKLWADIPGVRNTLLLSSALALGGGFEYQLRVDIEALSTLARVDETIRAGANGWSKTSKEWFAARTSARAHVSRHVAGDEEYARRESGKSGAIHLVLHSAAGEPRGLVDRVDQLRYASGVLATQALRPVLAGGGGQEQLWLRLESLEALDGLGKIADDELGDGRLFGELREVDGALFAGA